MFISMIRTVILYTVIIIAVRLMGKRQISQLQTSELVVTMLISDLAVIPMQDTGQPLFSGIIPILVLISLEIFLSLIMLKSGYIRRVVCGNPVIVIRDGKIQQQNMKELRMSIDELCEQLRQKDIFNLEEVDCAIVETNGALSVYKKAEADYIRPIDAGILPKESGPDFILVSDGKISLSSLKLCGKNENWLIKFLQKEKTSLREVFILTYNCTGKYTLIRKEKNK